MIVELYALPQGFTSPEDKPCLELFNYGLSNPNYKLVGDTVATPTLDDITVQVGNGGDYSIKDMQAYNFIKYDDTGYQIVNVELKQSAGVFYIYGKVDLYFTFLVSYFNTTGNRNGTPVYFKQKHLNRFLFTDATNNLIDNIDGVNPNQQFYLLSKYEALKNVGSKVDKTLINCNPSYYYPTSLTNGVKNVGGVSIPAVSNTNYGDSGAGYSMYPGSQTGSSNSTAFTQGIQCAGYYPVSVSYPNFFQSNPTGSYAYPCILGKMTPNETNILTNGSPYPFPYALGGIGGTQSLVGECYTPFSDATASGGGGTFGSAVPGGLNGQGDNGGTTAGGLHTFFDTSSNGFNVSDVSYGRVPSEGITSGIQAGPQGGQLVQDGGISDDYFTGVYMLPLPINYYTNIGIDKIATAIYQTAGNITGRFSVAGTQIKNPTGDTNSYFNIQLTSGGEVESVSLQPDKYYACFDPVIPLIQNQLYAWCYNPPTPTYNDLSEIEPALLNYERINVRLYGQDNYVDPMSFTNYLYFSNGLLQNLISYTMSFCLTVSPPNMTITNIPISIGNSTTLNEFPSDTNADLTFSNSIGNYNNLNDAIGSTILKAEAPNVANNGNNYLATSKNAYDTALNVSQLMAQQSMTSAVFGGIGAITSVATGNYAGGVQGLGGTLGGIFGAIAQEDQYNYLKTGKKLDMSRTSNMRVSATSTINTLFNACYTNIIEVPPLYEQVMVVNYYALHGYHLERGDPFSNGYNRKYCNYVSILFFSNTMMVNLSATGKGRIDKMLEDGFRVGSNVSELQKPSNDGGLTYDLILINSADGTYPNVELNQNNDEVNGLLGESNDGTSTLIKNQLDFYTTQTNNKNNSVPTNKDSTKD